MRLGLDVINLVAFPSSSIGIQSLVFPLSSAEALITGPPITMR